LTKATIAETLKDACLSLKALKLANIPFLKLWTDSPAHANA